MLKTFTILATVPERATATSLQAAAVSGITATFGVNAGDVRIDAFEGEHLTPAMGRGDVIRAHAALRNPPTPRTWANMTEEEQRRTMRAARDYGGGFVSTLVAAWNLADGTNAAKIGEAFGDLLLASYGPGSAFYENP